MILPDSEELCKTTSRWHCYITEKEGKYFITDGSFDIVPETAAKKPSVSGTSRNGQKITGPEELKQGDSLAIGPWNFSVEKAKNFLIDIDSDLEVMTDGKRATLKGENLKSPGDYKSLLELFMKLSHIGNIEDCLGRMMEYVAEKIPAAEVSAILIEHKGENPNARAAWQKKTGRIFDFKFSSNLLKQLSVKEPFLLTPRLSNPTLSQTSQKISSALLVPLFGKEERIGILYMDNRGRDKAFTEEDLHLAAALGSAVSFQLAMEKQIFMSRLEENLKQYFSPDVVRLLVKEANAGKSLGLDVSEQIASVLFVDMTGFSEFCHKHSPREVGELLNPYLKLMTECIHKHGGFVDKFIGDAVMGVFGGQITESQSQATEHALQAVRAARDMIKEWSNKTRLKWNMPIPLRVGINTGKMIIGNVGFPGRMEYTVLGDAVNLAARMQKLAAPNGIAVADETRLWIQKEFNCEDKGEREVKGFGTVKVWDIK